MNDVLPTQIFPRQLSPGACRAQRWLVIACLLLVSGCSSLSSRGFAELEIAPLQLPDRQVALADVARLAPTPDLLALDEDMVENLALSWSECEDIENLELDASDLHDFMFQIIHFCQIACNDDLVVYIYSDD